MKILFAPSNIASFSSSLSEKIKHYEGVTVKGFSIGRNKYVYYPQDWITIQYVAWKKNPFKRVVQYFYVTLKLIQLIFWADVIYWQSSINGLTIFDLHYKLLLLLKKPLFIEWVGSDIRKPAIVSSFNPFYKKAWEDGDYEYKKLESDTKSQQIQIAFQKLNAIPIVNAEMSLFIYRNLFPRIEMVNSRIDVNAFQISKTTNKECVLVHTPSAIGAKGSKYLREAIKNLQKKNLPFKYLEINNATRAEALEAIKSADIYIDQLIVGSYGMAALEAMAMGKPVICYLMKPVIDLLPQDCPIISTDIFKLENKLEELIKNPSLVEALGKRSRTYVEKYHNSDAIAFEVFSLFKSACK